MNNIFYFELDDNLNIITETITNSKMIVMGDSHTELVKVKVPVSSINYANISFRRKDGKILGPFAMTYSDGGFFSYNLRDDARVLAVAGELAFSIQLKTIESIGSSYSTTKVKATAELALFVQKAVGTSDNLTDAEAIIADFEGDISGIKASINTINSQLQNEIVPVIPNDASSVNKLTTDQSLESSVNTLKNDFIKNASLSYDSSTGLLTLTTRNGFDTPISTSIDLPLESAFVDAELIEVTEENIEGLGLSSSEIGKTYIRFYMASGQGVLMMDVSSLVNVNYGTDVFVEGEKVKTYNSDIKVDKDSTPSILYGTNSNGDNVTLKYDYGCGNNYIVQRDNNGNINAKPLDINYEGTAVPNASWVNSKLSQKMDKNTEWINYLENATYKSPSIYSFALYDDNTLEVNSGTYEVGTSFNLITKFYHVEENVDNIATLKFTDSTRNSVIDIPPSTVPTIYTLPNSIYLSSGTPGRFTFSLEITDTKGKTTSKALTFTITYYHYYIISDSNTIPTSRLTRGPKMNLTAPTEGADISYSFGNYLYWYCHTLTPTTAKLQQYDGAEWFNVETQYMGQQLIEIGNTNVEYKVFRTPKPFLASGNAKYRMGD